MGKVPLDRCKHSQPTTREIDVVFLPAFSFSIMLAVTPDRTPSPPRSSIFQGGRTGQASVCHSNPQPLEGWIAEGFRGSSRFQGKQ